MFPILHPTLDQEPGEDSATCSSFLLRALGKAQHTETQAEWSGLNDFLKQGRGPASPFYTLMYVDASMHRVELTLTCRGGMPA